MGCQETHGGNVATGVGWEGEPRKRTVLGYLGKASRACGLLGKPPYRQNRRLVERGIAVTGAQGSRHRS